MKTASRTRSRVVMSLATLRARHGEIVKTARTTASLRKGRNDWYRFEAKAGGTDVYIYDEIGYFGVTAQDFVAELKDVTGDLTVHINSPGGDVFDGIAILNALRAHKGTVTTVVDGLAASAASFIAQAGQKRVMSRNSEMMIHDASGLCIGNATDMAEMVATLGRVSDNIADVYAERSGRGDRAHWRAQMTAETWFSADEAVTAGLADEVEGKAEETSDSWDLSVFAHTNRAAAPEPVILPERAVFTFPSEMTPEQVDAFKARFDDAVKNGTTTILPAEPPSRAPFDIAAFKRGLGV